MARASSLVYVFVLALVASRSSGARSTSGKSNRRPVGETCEKAVEASPCLPGVHAEVLRPKAVAVRFLNADGVYDRRDFVDLEARSVLHQIDHLAGRMYFDNLGRVKRDMLLRRARKARV